MKLPISSSKNTKVSRLMPKTTNIRAEKVDNRALKFIWRVFAENRRSSCSSFSPNSWEVKQNHLFLKAEGSQTFLPETLKEPYQGLKNPFSVGLWRTADPHIIGVITKLTCYESVKQITQLDLIKLILCIYF